MRTPPKLEWVRSDRVREWLRKTCGVKISKKALETLDLNIKHAMGAANLRRELSGRKAVTAKDWGGFGATHDI